MYNINALIASVVTAVTSNGSEYIGTLLGTDGEMNIITLGEPRQVHVDTTGAVSLRPFALTMETTSVSINKDVLLTVCKSLDATAEEYTKMIQE